MPRLPKEQEMIFLHGIIKRLVSRFGREPQFTLIDIHTGGEGAGSRYLIAATRDLPEAVVLEHLKDLSQRGWVKLNLSNKPWTFQITPSFQDLPDLITPQDIMAEKIDLLSNQLAENYAAQYEPLKKAQKKLLSAVSEQDFSEIGNLCVQFWEDFTDALWVKYMGDKQKPEKDRTGDKMKPIVEKMIASKTTSDVYKALGELFVATSKLTQKTKHRGVQDKPVTLRDAKMVLLLTIVLAEEILTYAQ